MTRLIYDLADVAELTGYVRETIDLLEDETFRLSEYFPNQMQRGIEFKIPQGRDVAQMSAAKVRAFDTPVPIGERQGAMNLIRGELPPLGLKIPITEEQTLRNDMMRSGDGSALIDMIFDDTTHLVRATAARLELMRGELIDTGKIVFNENGVKAEVDWSRPADHDVTAATLWSNATNSTPFTDLLAWVKKYVDDTGVRPDHILTSERVLNSLILSQEIRELVVSVTGTTPSLISFDTLSALMTAFRLPPVRIYDVQAKVDGVLERVLPDNRLYLMPPSNEQMGATLMGETAESIKLVGASQLSGDDAAGLVGVVMETDEPVSTWTKVAGIGMPVMPSAELSFAATVL